MKILPKIYTLKEEAQIELYELFDKNIRPLKKKIDGAVDPFAKDLINNDVDAMRDSYVSGVYTMEFSESVAETLGRLYELVPGESSTESPKNFKKETNMDLWNNSIGQKYGKKSKTRKELFDFQKKSLENSELIIDINDSRKYNGATAIKKRPRGLVMVLEESKNGENLIFYDLDKNEVFNKGDFVASIQAGSYPDYEVRNIHGKETPVSKRDRFNFNNLG
jgi:hypothetical protein